MDYTNLVDIENHGNKLVYIWKCKKCGKEFKRTHNKNIRGLCDDCIFREQEERQRKATRRIEETAYKRIISQIKKRVKVAEIPTVTVNDEIYCNRKVFEDTLNEILTEFQKSIKDGD